MRDRQNSKALYSAVNWSLRLGASYTLAACGGNSNPPFYAGETLPPTTVLTATEVREPTTRFPATEVSAPPTVPLPPNAVSPTEEGMRAVLPDAEGRHLMFSRNIDASFDIIVIDSGTKKETNITNTPNSNELNAQVSPDGKWAVFYSDMVTPSNPRANNRIWQIDLKTYHLWQLTPDDQDVHYYDPTISPDGTTIAYKLDLGQAHQETNERGRIWLMNSDGTNQRELVLKNENGDPIHGEMWKPAFSADGKTIYVTVGTDNDSHIYRVNADGSGAATRLTPDNEFSHWFPAPHPTDPNLIAFVSNQTGNDQVYVMDAKGQQVRQVTNEEGFDVDDPSWNPDGSLNVIRNDGNQYDVYTVQADGRLNQVTNTPEDELSPVVYR